MYFSCPHLCTFTNSVSNLWCNYTKKLCGDTVETLVQLDSHAPTHTHKHTPHSMHRQQQSGVVKVETEGFNDTVSLRTLFP